MAAHREPVNPDVVQARGIIGLTIEDMLVFKRGNSISRLVIKVSDGHTLTIEPMEPGLNVSYMPHKEV